MIDILKNGLYGLIIGTAMLIPGVSGGTTAIILGIYDRLVSAVGSFFKDIRKNLLFLAVVALGGALGAVLFSKPLLALVNLWEAPMLCLFMGATAGSLPMLIRKSKSGFRLSSLFFAIAGFALVLSVSLLPKELFAFNSHSVTGFFILLAAGVPLAVGLVLPGISVSYLMVVIGIYKPLLEALSSFDLFFLAPLAIGLGLGILLTTKILEKAMSRFPGPTYYVIIGFVFGSILEIIREIPRPEHFYIYPACVLMFAAGVAAIWFYSSRVK